MTPFQKLAGLAVLILVLIAGAAGAAWQVQDWRYEKQLADRDAEQAIAKERAVIAAREEEQRRQVAVNEAGSYAREQNKAAAVDASNADAAGVRLHIEAGKLAAAACGDPGAAHRGASATSAAMVLSDLLQRADKRAGELAAAYDRAKIAGLSCEHAYRVIREGSAGSQAR
ncbi:DUF2514 family protein [Pseudomonas tolaasii]|uniref:DUF2514 family protein n=1 Tax=Pseudomonas tolaasii TaxID=29442 RepID=UPI001C531C13|nr:DUF2514 family protein [Pseudomonas tolaasii]QXQ16604.1 DUF2514 domain-containing protein [Pseudomonas tolaasii]